MEDSYKEEHEAFVSGSNGTTACEILYLSLITPLWSMTLSALLIALQISTNIRSYWFYGIAEALLLNLPLISGITFLNDKIEVLFAIITVMFVLNLLLQKCMPTSFCQENYRSETEFITHYRSQLLLDTSLSILAVDFPVYPRCLAKTELYGFGYMDVGVGCFIFAAGTISPEARAIPMTSKRKYIQTAIRSSALMALLGIIRALSIWATNYHMQVSEYGVHWNFFITIAVVRVICSGLTSVLNVNLVTVLVGGFCLCYQWLLSLRGLTDFILEEHREGFFQQNKEGILSLGGYAFLYLVATQVGRVIFRSSSGNKRSLLLKLSILVATSFVATVTSHHFIQPVSRRLLNLSYILWMVFFNCFHLTVHALLDAVSPSSCKISIFKAVNRNAIFHFLLANLATGAINFTMNTIHASTSMSTLVIFLYNAFLSIAVLYLFKNNLIVNLLQLQIKNR